MSLSSVRLQTLERELQEMRGELHSQKQRLRLTTILLMLALFVPWLSPWFATTPVVRTKRLELVDDNGVIRMEATVDDKHRAAWRLLSETGVASMSHVGTADGRKVSTEIRDAKNVVRLRHTVADQKLGGVNSELLASDGSIRASVNLQNDQSGSIALADTNAVPRVLATAAYSRVHLLDGEGVPRVQLKASSSDAEVGLHVNTDKGTTGASLIVENDPSLPQLRLSYTDPRKMRHRQHRSHLRRLRRRGIPHLTGRVQLNKILEPWRNPIQLPVAAQLGLQALMQADSQNHPDEAHPFFTLFNTRNKPALAMQLGHNSNPKMMAWDLLEKEYKVVEASVSDEQAAKVTLAPSPPARPPQIEVCDFESVQVTVNSEYETTDGKTADWLADRWSPKVRNATGQLPPLEPVIIVPGMFASVLTAKKLATENTQSPLESKECYFGDAKDYEVFFMAPRYALHTEKWDELYAMAELTPEFYTHEETGEKRVHFRDAAGNKVCPHDFGGVKGIDYLARSYLDWDAHWLEFLVRLWPYQDKLTAVQYEYSGRLMDANMDVNRTAKAGGGSEWVAGDKYAQLIGYLVKAGYKVGKNLFGAPYDWRKPISDQEDYRKALRALIEKASALNGGRKVQVIAHSMGNYQFLKFQQWMEEKQTGGTEWLDTHVSKYVSVNAPFLGAPQALRTLISGGLMSSAPWPREGLYKMVRSMGGLYSMLPSENYTRVVEQLPDRSVTDPTWVNITEPRAAPFVIFDDCSDVSDTHPDCVASQSWDKQLRNRTFDSSQVSELFRFLGRDDMGEIVEAMHHDREIVEAYQPRVPTYCLFAHGSPTEFGMRYRGVPVEGVSRTGPLEQEPEFGFGCTDGDGLLSTNSMRYCENWKSLVFSLPFDKRGHSSMLKDAVALDEILTILTNDTTRARDVPRKPFFFPTQRTVPRHAQSIIQKKLCVALRQHANMGQSYRQACNDIDAAGSLLSQFDVKFQIQRSELLDMCMELGRGDGCAGGDKEE